MPIVSVSRDALFQRLGENFGSKPNLPSPEADKSFDELCFKFGIELDDVTSEKVMKQKETGSADERASDSIIYKIDVPANRYDILCLEGISRALRIFLNKETPPLYKLTKPKSVEKMYIKDSVLGVRPIVVAAILRNMSFNEENYQSFIDLQEKLHVNICRKRSLVSIGTHDLDTIQGPFSYEALPPKEIKFAPLNNTTVMDGQQLMEHLSNDLHLKKYLPLIRDSPVYPVIFDSNRTVLSLPPIINSNHSKITLNTRNVFIEVTATDKTKAEIVLNTVCAMFSEYCEPKFTIEPVEVIDAKGSSVYPNVEPREVETSIEYINRSIGIELSPQKVADLLSKMSLTARLSDDKKNVITSVPITRSDIFHSCDVMEDVAIAYGYDNIEHVAPQTATTGRQQPLNKVTDLIRREVALAGYSEVFTFALCSRDENFTFLNKVDDNSAVTIANPKTLEFQVARTSLLVGVLKILSNNKQAPLPIRIFELSDVVLRDNVTDVGAHNERRLCALHASHTSGFEVIQGLLDRVMQMLDVVWLENGKEPSKNKHYYYIKEGNDPSFFPGRSAHVYLNDKKIGVIGTLHPNVLKNFGIPHPSSAFEISIQPFV